MMQNKRQKEKIKYNCEACNFSCPWEPTGNGTVRHCPAYLEKTYGKKIIDMAGRTDRKIKGCPTFQELDFEKNKIQDKVKAIRQIHNHMNHLFFVRSNSGTGKTHILLAYAMELLARGISVWYTSAFRMRQVFLKDEEIYESKREWNEECNSIMNSYILIVDDFCYEGYSQSGHFQRKLAPILTSDARKIILASNVGRFEDNFPYKKEFWIMDRLNQAVEIAWHGESYRKPRR